MEEGRELFEQSPVHICIWRRGRDGKGRCSCKQQVMITLQFCAVPTIASIYVESAGQQFSLSVLRLNIQKVAALNSVSPSTGSTASAQRVN